jgi:hypothetical protein
MNTIVVAKLAVEGGGADILARETDGRWAFWQAGSSVFDADGGNEGRCWRSEPVADLAQVLPKIWPLMSPIGVHPEFLDWFRTHYEAARAALPAHEREYQEQLPHRRWQWIFTGNRLPRFSRG